MPTNHAAYVTGPKVTPFKVDEAPMPKIGPTAVGIRIHAIAINPVDYMMQRMDMMIQQDPFILGVDGAGEVYEVGSEVTQFKPGDRVLAMFHNLTSQNNINASFQQYAAAEQAVTARLADNITYDQGAVLPLALSTVASGIYQQDGMQIPLPSLKPSSNGKVALVWGGSSSVGATAIQLFRASGYDVAAVAGAANQHFCKDLGAKYVFNYKDSDIEQKILDTLKGQDFGGALEATQSDEVILMLGRITSQLGGHKYVTSVKPPVFPAPEGFTKDVKFVPIFGSSLLFNEVGPAIFNDFTEKALANGVLKAKPDPVVFGKDLEVLQDACDHLANGVSAQKIVVQLP